MIRSCVGRKLTAHIRISCCCCLFLYVAMVVCSGQSGPSIAVVEFPVSVFITNTSTHGSGKPGQCS